jgi:site-specific recombinase XerC
MGIAQYDPASIGRPARTAGRMVGVKKSLKQRQLWAFRFFLEWEGRMRDRALFDLAIDRKLRGCDLEKPKIGMLVNGPAIRTRAMVVQQKTSRPEQFEITADVRASLLAWLERRGGTVDDYAFPSRVDPAGHLSNRQHARLVDEWVTAIGMQPQNYGTHSLRRTTAAMIYKVTGNLRAVQILLGHTKIKNAFRYLGLDIEDALELAEHTET